MHLAGAGLVCLSLSGVAQAATCAKPAEVEAVQTRILQSELMVAALTCNAADGYNRFARKFQDELVSRGQALRAYFKRIHGAKAERELNGFVTRLANQASQHSVAQGSAYCQSALAQLKTVLSLPKGGLQQITAIQPTSVKVCQQQLASE